VTVSIYVGSVVEREEESIRVVERNKHSSSCLLGLFNSYLQHTNNLEPAIAIALAL
jgi:hypothetical protein